VTIKLAYERMPELKRDTKGVLLIIVLGTIIVVTLLATVILRIFSNQYRLTNHNITRIQAYYVALAGINHAMELLRTGQYPAGTPPYTYNLTDQSFPPVIANKTVLVNINGSITNATIKASINYNASTP
jgi:Tfp pilus assembly protein PilX